MTKQKPPGSIDNDSAKAVEPQLVLVDDPVTGVRRLVLNRPELLNAIDIHLADALLSCLDAGRRDSGVRCLVLTGAG